MEVKDVGDWTLVRFTEKSLNERSTPAVEQQIAHLIDVSGRRQLYLDFANVTFLASRGIVMLLSLRKKLAANGGQMVLCNILPQVLEVFEVLKLHTFFEIRQNFKPDAPQESSPSPS